METNDKGFTLIELLVVVAIVAILAAIAVPNFLEAQTRSKVSRFRSDARSLTVAIEAYTVDANMAPMDGYDWGRKTGEMPPYNWDYILICVTTPVAYLTALPNEVFVMPNENYGTHIWYSTKTGYYVNRPEHDPNLPTALFAGNRARYNWVLISPGPDLFWEYDRCPGGYVAKKSKLPYYGDTIYYDPTNGTNSQGDLYVFGSGNAYNPQ